LYYLRELSGKKARITAVDTRRKGGVIVPQEGGVETAGAVQEAAVPAITDATPPSAPKAKENPAKAGKEK
jgi:hypothetical protein